MYKLAQQAKDAREAARRAALYGKADVAKQYEAQAADFDTQRKQMFDEYKDFIKPTEATKTAQEAGSKNSIEYEASKAAATETAKTAAGREEKTFTGIAGGSTAATSVLDNAQQAKSLLNNSALATGYGARGTMTIEGLKSWAGGDPERLAAMQAFTKITARNVMDQIAFMRDAINGRTGGAGGTRMFAPEIQKMIEASASVENSMMGNRMLVEIQQRSAERAKYIMQEAVKYRAAHGKLDDNWYAYLDHKLADHPMFKSEELAHPTSLIGAIEPPKEITGDRNKMRTWAIRSIKSNQTMPSVCRMASICRGVLF